MLVRISADMLAQNFVVTFPPILRGTFELCPTTDFAKGVSVNCELFSTISRRTFRDSNCLWRGFVGEVTQNYCVKMIITNIGLEAMTCQSHDAT